MINNENFDKFWKFVKFVAELAFVPENTIYGRIRKYPCRLGVASVIGALINIPTQDVTEILDGHAADDTDNDDFPWTVQNEQQAADDIRGCEDIEGLDTNQLLENVSNNTHTLTHLMVNLINIAQAAALDAHDRNAYNTKPCRQDDDKHSDSKLSRIIVTFNSPHMTQEIGSAEVDEDGIHIIGVNLGINRIDKRIDIVRALEDIVNTINSTPEVKR